MKKGNLWLIPQNASRPDDGRRKEKLNSGQQYSMAPLFQPLNSNEAMLSRIIELFPYPIHVYAADGMMVLTNEACLRVMHIPSKEHIVGKFNVLKDPIIDQWGEEVRAQIERSFQGEIIHFQNLNMPIRGIIDRFETDELCFDSCYQNIICYPIYNDQDQLAYVVHVFVTAKLYDGKEEMVKAKEYIENNWLEEFDINELLRVVNLSRYHFARLFKSNTGMTPYGYYQNVKICKIKERLCDKNLSVSQVFSSCGVDYNGNYARIFKTKVGMTPSQYRNTVI
jgi:AraC-like DNA-binding protein